MDQPTGGWRVQLDRNSPLDAAAQRGELTEAEYLGADKWRSVHIKYLRYLEDTEQYTDLAAEVIERNYKRGVAILTGDGRHRRIFHAVCSLCTYGDPDELGDPAYTMAAAKVGFRELSERF